MKKSTLALAVLMMIAVQRHGISQTEPGAPINGESPVSQSQPRSSPEESKDESVPVEVESSEPKSAMIPYDAFLTESGYVVYPVEENCAVLQAKVSKNPMVLHKEFIPRLVYVIRRVDGRRADGSVQGVLGKQFMIVSEVGAASQFMVELKDLHFPQKKDEAMNISK